MLLEHKPRKTERTNRYRISSTKNRRKSLQEMPLPGACETLKPQQDSWTGQAKRMPKKLFHVTFGTHNLLCFWSTSLARPNARTGIESPAPKTVENRCKRCLCQAPAKHSNPSRIRGQAKQNACQKNSFTLPLEPPKKKKRAPVHRPKTWRNVAWTSRKRSSSARDAKQPNTT